MERALELESMVKDGSFSLILFLTLQDYCYLQEALLYLSLHD